MFITNGRCTNTFCRGNIAHDNLYDEYYCILCATPYDKYGEPILAKVGEKSDLRRDGFIQIERRLSNISE